ncbi:ABC transporter substrate-binding protein, partial [Rhizobiaceae sp. 2RAB30]
DFLQGFRKGIEKVAPGKELTEISYEAAESLVDPQVDSLHSAGVQSLAVFALPKFCAQTIRRAAETGWKPTIVVGVVCTSVDLALRPAGLENAVGVHSGLWMLDPADPRNADDPEVQAFKEFMAKYYPAGNIDFINADAYMNASTLVEILKRAGDDLSRQNILKITASLGQWRGPMLVGGVYSNLTPDNYQTITTIPIVRFDGAQWDSVSDN